MSRSDGFRGPGADAFADRVMATVAAEPTPTPTRALVSAIRARSARDAAAAVGTAWHLGTVRTWAIAPRVRLHAAALVLSVIAVLSTSATLAAASVVYVIEQVNEQGQTQNDQSGTDEQSPMENVDDGQSDTDAPGQDPDQPGGTEGDEDDQPGSDDATSGEQGPNETGGDESTDDGNDGPSGADQPIPDDSAGEDQPGGDDRSSGGEEPGGDSGEIVSDG